MYLRTSSHCAQEPSPSCPFPSFRMQRGFDGVEVPPLDPTSWKSGHKHRRSVGLSPHPRPRAWAWAWAWAAGGTPPSRETARRGCRIAAPAPSPHSHAAATTCRAWFPRLGLSVRDARQLDDSTQVCACIRRAIPVLTASRPMSKRGRPRLATVHGSLGRHSPVSHAFHHGRRS